MIIILTEPSTGNKLLVNDDAIQHVQGTTAGGEDAAHIYFQGGACLTVKESVDQVHAVIMETYQAQVVCLSGEELPSIEGPGSDSLN